MSAAVRYSLLRLLLLLGCLIAVWLIADALGLHDPILVFLIAAVVSVALSFFLLRGPREAMTREVTDRLASRTAQHERPDDVEEDAEADALASAQPERQAGQDPEGELAPPGVAQRGDEAASAGPAGDGSQGRDEQQR